MPVNSSLEVAHLHVEQRQIGLEAAQRRLHADFDLVDLFRLERRIGILPCNNDRVSVGANRRVSAEFSRFGRGGIKIEAARFEAMAVTGIEQDIVGHLVSELAGIGDFIILEGLPPFARQRQQAACKTATQRRRCGQGDRSDKGEAIQADKTIGNRCIGDGAGKDSICAGLACAVRCRQLIETGSFLLIDITRTQRQAQPVGEVDHMWVNIEKVVAS